MIASRVDTSAEDLLPWAQVVAHVSTWLAVSVLVAKSHGRLPGAFERGANVEARALREIRGVLAGSLSAVSAFSRRTKTSEASKTVATGVFESVFATLARQARKQGRDLGKLFEKRSDARVLRRSPKRVRASLRKTFGSELKRSEVRKAIQKFSDENAKRIRDFATEEHRRVAILTRKAIRGGWTTERYANEIKKLTDITKRRALNIARDQVMRFNSDMTTYLAGRVGAKRFTWHHTPQPNPRVEHQARNGKTYYYSNPPPDMPGILPHCKCVAEPIFPRPPR